MTRLSGVSPASNDAETRRLLIEKWARFQAAWREERKNCLETIESALEG
jgi:hypothetical protein